MPMIDGIEQRLRAVAKTAGNDFHQARSGCPYCDDFRDYATPAAVLALLDTIAELRRAEAEAYERAAKECESMRSD